MKKIIIRSMQFVVICFVTMFSLNAADIKKGNWEMTFTTTMTGMPMAIQIPVKTVTECIDSNEFIPESGDDGECSHSSRKASSNKIEWEINCPSNGMKGRGEMEFNNKSMDGHMEMKMDMMGQKMSVDIIITGKYLGSCN